VEGGDIVSRIVPFEGPTNAKIYIVGEAPGVHEEMEMRPFVGGAGRLLDRLLMETGLVRKECRLANVMRVRPVGNNFAHFYIDRQLRLQSQELLDGITYLKEDIRRCNPNVVLALGNEPLRALIGERGITKWRGSILFSKDVGCKVIPTIHPASLLRMWDNVPLVMFDFKRLKEESLSPDYAIPHRAFMLAPTYEQVMEWLHRLHSVKRVSFDVETDIATNWMTAIAFADAPFSAISIPFTRGTAPYWTIEDEVEIWKEIKLLLEDEGVEKIAQNAQFDIIMSAINPYHSKVKNLWMDTMCGFHTLYPEIAAGMSELTGKSRLGGGKSLALLGSIFTRQPYYKHWAHTSDDKMFWKYNAMDAAVTYEVALEIEKEMEEMGVTDFYHEFVHPLLPILLKVQMQGVKLDQGVRVKAELDYTKETALLQVKLDNVVGRAVNVNSNKQMRELLYGDLKLPTKYKRGTTNITADEEALVTLSKQYPSPIFDLILKIRHNRKLLSTYLVNRGGEDGRIRCSYVIGGTETGRLSSRKSVFGTGTNLQNIPKGICRKMFVADEGKVFVEVDLSQAEARVVAHLSEDEKLIEAFGGKDDVYKSIASWIFNKSIGDITTGDKKSDREKAKHLVHASNYGIGPRTFAFVADIGGKEAKLLLQRYFDTFPKIKAWQFSVQSQLRRSRTMVTPMGRKRTFFGRWGDQLFREAYAFVPQSVVGDVLNKAIINLNVIHPEAEFMLQNHDAFVVQVKIEHLEEEMRLIERAFDIPISIKGRTLVIPVDFKVGKNWQDMEKVE